MFSRIVLASAMIALLAISPCAYSEFRVTASTPEVTITAEQSARSLIALPALTYTVAVRAECDRGHQATNVTVTAADSVATLIDQSADIVELQLEVPAAQLAAVRIPDFCADPDTAVSRLLVRGAYTAQATANCTDTDSGELVSVNYASTRLDVSLACEEEAEEDGNADASDEQLAD